MPKEKFYELIARELKRTDDSKTSKRWEKVIEGFTKDKKAIIGGKKYLVFNSNDYLGLRFNPRVNKAEEEAAKKYGSGPGAVRFIAGTLKVHVELEEKVAEFHKREAGMVFSSAFAANMAVLHCIIKGQSSASLVGGETLVVSDELNHRSIIDGIRVAGLPKENRAIFKHMDYEELDKVLSENAGKFKRAIVVSDGIFSMLGECPDLRKMVEVCNKHDGDYEEGVISVVDDSHGVACFGETGRGCEEKAGAKCDLLVGTFGKGFGSDGGYVVGDKIIVDYLRESAATYIYSNPVSPGTAAAALEALNVVDSPEGKGLIRKLNENIRYFKEKAKNAGLKFSAESEHPIQPVLIGDAAKAKELTDALFENGILVTNISFPVVPKGKDEIRVQLSAAHSKADIDEFIGKISSCAKELGI
ncbi:MAG: aminotransferase class I/II-fold pyridoxal phosphate-dependent enzyme [Candidatus Anstonellales archaeon]